MEPGSNERKEPSEGSKGHIKTEGLPSGGGSSPWSCKINQLHIQRQSPCHPVRIQALHSHPVRLFRTVISEAVNTKLWDEWESIYTNLFNENHEEDARTFYEAHKEKMLLGAEVLWEEKLSYYDLMEIKVSEGTASFNSELQNDPIDPESATFNPEWFDYYEPELMDFSSPEFVFVGANDPSLGKNKKSDTSSIINLATVVPSTTGEQDYKWLGQMPGMREWIGEREVQALAAYDYLIKNKKFEMTIGVPRDDIEDDKYGVYTPLFSNMGEAAALHPDELVFGAMMSGFNEKCYDGLSFFNTAHKVGDATYSNRSNKKLSRESYMEGRSSIMSIKGDKGKSLKLVPDLLVVPPALEETARLILEADQIDGTTNVLKGTAKLHVEPALAEHPEDWFLLCTNRFLKPFIYQLRKKIKFTSLTRDTDENVFMLDEYLYGADGRSNAGYGFWQMAYGSTGEVEAQAQG